MRNLIYGHKIKRSKPGQNNICRDSDEKLSKWEMKDFNSQIQEILWTESKINTKKTRSA